MRRKVRLQTRAAYEARGDRSRDDLVPKLVPSAIANRDNGTKLMTPEAEDADGRRSTTGKHPGSEEHLAAFGKIEDNDGTIVFRPRPTDCEHEFGELTRCLRTPGAFFEHFSKLCETDQSATRFCETSSLPVQLRSLFQIISHANSRLRVTRPVRCASSIMADHCHFTNQRSTRVALPCLLQGAAQL